MSPSCRQRAHLGRPDFAIWIILVLFFFVASVVEAAEKLKIATYNLENYLLAATSSRPQKSETARAKIREIVAAINPDILALQEIGSNEALVELQRALRIQGVDFPHSELVRGYDTNIFVALLSKIPIQARHSHQDKKFLLYGRRFQMSRGILDVDFQTADRYAFTLLSAHLKSQRISTLADESEIREQEALLLREVVDARLKANPGLNLIVLGDFNDTKESKAIRTLLGRGKTGLIDTRPAEKSSFPVASASGNSNRRITWTHFFATEDTYSRIDYILLSSGMAREWISAESFIFTTPDWGQASDHRPLVATFRTPD